MANDLWPDMLRVVADVAPGIVFAENVATKAIDKAANDLEALGYAVICMALSAEDMGGDHVRQRYWLFAHAHMHGELLRTQYAEMAQRSRLYPGVWATQPREPRMADGMAAGMVRRLEATGNGQVPIVAATAFRILMETTP